MMRFSTWQRKRYHSSWALGWLCFGLLVGLGLSKVTTVPAHTLFVVALIIVIVVSLVRTRWYAMAVLVMTAIMLGIMRGNAVSQQLALTDKLVGSAVTLQGVITEDPQITARGDTRVVLSSLRDARHHYLGSLWLSIRGEKSYRRGDGLTIRAVMKPGFGVYQLSATYVEVSDYVANHDPLLGFRDAFSAALRRTVVEPSASLGIGFVVGQKTSLPPQLEDQLRVVGLTHLVVASGYNLTILVRFAKRLFEKRSKFLVAFVSTSLIAGFIGISGASPSMVRASMVAGLSILAWYYGRRFHPMLLILYVSALTAMINPLYVWADVGWWLSFLAFFGVLVVSPLLIRVVLRGHKVSSLLQIVFETTAAQIMTLPLILMVFGNLPVLSLIANILSAPFIPLAMLLTFVGGMVSLLLPALGMFVSLPAEILLSYFVAVIRWLSKPEWAQVTLTITTPLMVMIYSGVIMTVIVMVRHTRYNFRSQSLIE